MQPVVGPSVGRSEPGFGSPTPVAWRCLANDAPDCNGRGCRLLLLVGGLTDSLLPRVAVCQVALAFCFDGPAALNRRQFIDELALFAQKSRVEFEGAVHDGSEPGIGVAPHPGAPAEYVRRRTRHALCRAWPEKESLDDRTGDV